MNLESDKIIEVETNGGSYTIEVPPRHVSIDESCIDADLCSMGKFLLYYGEIDAAIKIEVERKEAELDRLEADLDAQIRANASITNDKLTEARVKGLVTTNSNRLQLVESLLKSKKNYNMMRWIMAALNAKKDCLIALSYRENQMMKAERFSS